MMWVRIAAAWPLIIVAYLVGSIPFGIFVSRVFFKTDIRASGSGNIGAANALRTMGRGAGLGVLLLDALKGAVAVGLPFIALRLHVPLPPPPCTTCSYDIETLSGLCALAAIVGHCYSPWLRFTGGKGVATFLGIIIVASWPAALAFAFAWLAIVLSNGYASLGSIAATLIAIAIVAAHNPKTLYVSIPAAAVIIWKHRDNIARLIAGTESKLQLSQKRGDEPRVRRGGPSS